MHRFVRVKYRFFSTVLILLLLLSLLESHTLLAYVLLNLGQLQLVNQQTTLRPYLQAFDLVPDNDNLRRQAGIALARSGRQEDAMNLLIPYLKHYPEKLAERIVYSNLIANKQYADVLKLSIAHGPIDIQSPTAAAAVLISRLHSNLRFNPQENKDLLVHVFYLQGTPVTTTARLLSPYWSELDWETTDLGIRLQNLLFWKSQPLLPQELIPQITDSHMKVNKYEDHINMAHLSHILKVQESQFSFGSELAVNGDFEQPAPCLAYFEAPWCVSQGWTSSFTNSGDPWNIGLFMLGADHEKTYNGNRSMRIDGVVIENRNSLEPARAGFESQEIQLESNQIYFISFVYQTQTALSVNNLTMPVATIWLSYDEKAIFAGDYQLPATDSTWHHVLIIGRNNSPNTVTIRPLLRLWQEGTIWFDNFSIRPITWPDSSKLIELIIDVKSIDQLQNIPTLQ